MGKYIKKLVSILIVITTILASSITYTRLVQAEGPDTQESTDVIVYAIKDGEFHEIKDRVIYWLNHYGNEVQGYTFVLNQDLEISEPFYVQSTWTIKMNGHKIYRSLSSPVDNGEIFNLLAYSTLNLLGVGDSRVPDGSDEVQNREFTYYGYRKDDSTTDDTKAELTVTAGGLITGGNSKSTAGAIHMHYGSTLNLDNVAVNGNYTESTGSASGAIYLDKRNDNIDYHDYTITMNNAHIDHNYSHSSGGGIKIDESDTTTNLTMVNSSIDYNISGSAGGGIISFSKLILNKNQETIDYSSTISHNYAGNNGGGIYCAESSEGSEIKKVKINNNYAGNPGGGLYLYAENVKLDDCEISGNITEARGGGIYVDAEGTIIRNCKITGNKVNTKPGYFGYGGGIYVPYFYDVELNGKTIVENNYNSYGNQDNVYLNSYLWIHAYINGSASEGAHIGVNSDSTGSQLLGEKISNYVEGRYFLDKPENLHLEYKSDSKKLYQEKGGSTKYTLTVNGEKIGSYYAGKTVTISDNNQDTEKLFLNWDASNAQGITITNEQKEQQVFTITMPSNDVSIDAKYLERLTSLKLTIIENSPTAGRYLPDSVKYTYGPDEQSRWSWDVEWYEVNDDGSMTPTSGRAKENTIYAFKLQLAKDISKGLVFSDSIGPENITIKFGDGTTITASSVSIDEAGTLTIISDYLTTGTKSITVNSFESTYITVQEGIYKADLINALPSTAIGVDTDNNKDIYRVDKEHITDDMIASLIRGDAVVKPESGSATIELPIVRLDNVTFAENAKFNVTVNVTADEPTTVERPTVTKASGTYPGTSLTVEATTATEGATIYYTIDDGDTQGYNTQTGIVLTTEAGTSQTFNVNVWATKNDVSSNTLSLEYTLDGQVTTQNTVTINCSDTSLVPEGEEAWSDSVIKSYDTGTRVTVYAPTIKGRTFQKWVYTNEQQEKVESTDLYFTFESLSKNERIEAIYNPVMTTISFNVPYPQATESLAAKEDITVIATLAGKTTDITKYFDLDNLSWIPNDEIADYDTSYTVKLPILHNIEGSKFALADKLVVMVNGNTDKRLIVNLDSTRENAYVTFPETEAKPYEPTPTPTATSETKKKDSGWDDGGPFVTDSCGNVFDRWGNKIYEATSCNVGGYNLVRTDTKD